VNEQREGVIFCSQCCCYYTVGRSVCHNREPSKNGLTDRDAVWVVDSGGPKEPRIRWMHIDATWRIRRNCPCAATTRPYVKLIKPIVIIIIIVTIIIIYIYYIRLWGRLGHSRSLPMLPTSCSPSVLIMFQPSSFLRYGELLVENCKSSCSMCIILTLTGDTNSRNTEPSQIDITLHNWTRPPRVPLRCTKSNSHPIKTASEPLQLCTGVNSRIG